MLMQMQATGTIGIKLMASPKIAAVLILFLEAAPLAPLLMAVEVAMVRSSLKKELVRILTWEALMAVQQEWAI